MFNWWDNETRGLEVDEREDGGRVLRGELQKICATTFLEREGNYA